MWVLQSTWKGPLAASFPEKTVLQLWAAVGHGARGSWHQTAVMALRHTEGTHQMCDQEGFPHVVLQCFCHHTPIPASHGRAARVTNL